MEVKTVTAVYVFVDGMSRRVYKTSREPPRFFYMVEGTRFYIDDSLLTKKQKSIIQVRKWGKQNGYKESKYYKSRR